MGKLCVLCAILVAAFHLSDQVADGQQTDNNLYRIIKDASTLQAPVCGKLLGSAKCKEVREIRTTRKLIFFAPLHQGLNKRGIAGTRRDLPGEAGHGDEVPAEKDFEAGARI